MTRRLSGLLKLDALLVQPNGQKTLSHLAAAP